MKPRFFPPVAVATLALAVAALSAAPARSQMDRAPGGKQALEALETRNCGTPVPSLAEMEQVEAVVGQWLRAHPDVLLAVGGQIKVAFHVIYAGNEGNIPQSQIDAQIAELNKAFSGFYGGASTGYTFVLASVDRTNSRKWFRMTPGSNAESQAKNSLAIDPAHRLNLYTCKPGQNLLGWAVFPWSYAESSKQHGVVIHDGSVPGGFLSPYNLGGTADHEVGHYLGLYHTFQGGCSEPNDFVADTPQEGTATSGCPEGKDTCPSPGLDPIHNYMDYSTDACYTEFTLGQDGRMDNIVPAYRPSLLNAALAMGSRPDAGLLNGDPDVGQAGGNVAFRGAFPNPFGTETLMRFYLPRSERVSLKVYNVAGQLVETVVDGELPAGEQTALFRARDLKSGMYFAALKLGTGETVSRTVILVR